MQFKKKKIMRKQKKVLLWKERNFCLTLVNMTNKIKEHPNINLEIEEYPELFQLRCSLQEHKERLAISSRTAKLWLQYTQQLLTGSFKLFDVNVNLPPNIHAALRHVHVVNELCCWRVGTIMARIVKTKQL